MFVITDPDQMPPKQTCDCLVKNSSFKQEICNFVYREWQKPHYQSILDGKTLYVAIENSCVCIEGTASLSQSVTYPTNLQGKHAEADTLIAFHAAESKGDIMIWASDTDILVVLISMIG